MKQKLIITLTVIAFSALLSMLFAEWEWSEVSQMRQPRMEHMSAVVNGEIYVFGGRQMQMRPRRNVVLANAEKYDPVEDEWSAIRPMPYPLYLADAVAVGEMIYIFGGVTSQRMLQPIDSVLVYDTERNGYRVIGRMPDAKYSMEVTYFPRRGEILVAGGIGQSLDDFFRTTWWYDIRENEWSDGFNLPRPLAKFGMAVGADSLWITGGFSFGGPQNRCHVMTQRGWGVRAELPVQCGDPGSVFLGDTLINAGGTGSRRGEEFYLNDVFAFTPGEDEWRRLPEMNLSRTSFELVALGDSAVYAIGGLNRHNHRQWDILSSVEMYYNDVGMNAVPGVQDESSPEFSINISPNPSHGLVRFNLPFIDSRIKIFDLHGRIVAGQFHSEGGVWTWNSVGYPTGTYFYAVTLGTGSSPITGRIYVVK